MSLIKQLWLAIALVMFIAFGGSFLVSSLSAQTYLREQLLLKNIDNATSLAATLSQLPKDPVSVELLVSAQFDTGHYEYIRLEDPHGQAIVERVSDASSNGAPAWFMNMLPISAAPGVAQVQDGWQQYGTLTMASHTRFAYRELWNSTLRLLLWFVVAAVVTATAGTLLLRMILRPLGAVVVQAEAIGARRFITTPEPATLEFQAVVRSMNSLAKRVRQMLEEESVRLDALRRDANFDEGTGMLNRAHFVARLQALLGREDASASGSMLIARLMDLADLNRAEGWGVMDTLIKRFAQAMRAMEPEQEEWLFGRLNGSDFALIAPGHEDTAELARRVSESMRMLVRELELKSACRLPVGATGYRYGEGLGGVLGRVDAALQGAASDGSADATRVLQGDQQQVTPAKPLDLAAWKSRLDTALQAGRVLLQSFPVVDRGGLQLHGECVARMRFEEGGELVPAGVFMPWVSRLDYGARLDQAVIEQAIGKLAAEPGDLCINVSAQTMQDAVMLQGIARRLGAAPELARRLWLEVPENGVFQAIDQFRVFCALLKPTGCRLGIEHVGHQVSRLGQLHDLGLDYLKIDGSFIDGLAENQANQVFLRGLVLIAHSIGLSAIAEGVRAREDLDVLVELGFDAMTGPAVSAAG